MLMLMSSSRYPHLEWQEITPGYWEREIDEAEQFYTYIAKLYEGCGGTPFAIMGFVSLSIEVEKDITQSSMATRVDEALCSAWMKLRHEHPTIASKITYDPLRERWIKSYTNLKAAPMLEQSSPWLRETFVVVDTHMTGPEWCNSSPVSSKSPTLFIIASTSVEDRNDIVRRDLVLRSPPNIVDGIGTLHLLDSLIANLNQWLKQPSLWKLPPQSNEENASLCPPLRVAAGMPPILRLDQQDRLQQIIAQNASLAQRCEVLALPYAKGAVVPGQSQRIATEISESETKKILQACRTAGITVTHAFHTATACVLRNLQEPTEESRQSRYISYFLLNLRPKCKGDYRTARYAASVYHTVSGESLVLDLMIPSLRDKNEGLCTTQSEFLALVKRVKSFYESVRDSPDGLALAPCFWSMATPHLVHPASQPHETPVPEPNMVPSVFLSSMGVIDKIVSPQYGLIKVDDPWVSGDELSTGIGVFLSSWEGKLQLSATYNDAWHDELEVECFLKNCQKVVQRGLGIDE